MTRYIVYGAGAIGATIGAKLHQSGRRVALIARGEHLERLRADGLQLLAPDADAQLQIPAYESPAAADAQPGDVVVLAMKSQDTKQALEELVAVDRSEQLVVVCAQNGVENERVALRLFAHVYGMFVYLAAEHVRPGVVSAFSAPCVGVLDLGRVPRGADRAAEQISCDLNDAGFSSRAAPEIVPWKYAKLLSNLANAIGAILGPDAEEEDLVERARHEALLCYEAAGIAFVDRHEVNERTAVVSALRAVHGHEHSGSSSVQSLQRGTGAIETDYLNGEIVLLGRAHGVATPVNTALTHVARRMARDGLQPGGLGQAVVKDEIACDAARAAV
jgi:2-dehydropantoate 2-reductase